MSRIQSRNKKSKDNSAKANKARIQVKGAANSSSGLSLAPTWNNSLIILEDLNRIGWYQRAINAHRDMPDAS